MNKYILLIFFCFPFLLTANLSTEFKQYSVELESAIQRIYQLPEARDLIKLANTKGAVSVETMKQNIAFKGLWSGSSRTIYVKTSPKRPLGSLIQTIVFELHNAVGNGAFEQLWEQARQGTISKNAFVERAERCEHTHLMKTQKLIDRGIARGIFPSDTRLSFIPDFQLHYSLQQISGHSDWFAKQYDRICPPHLRTSYRGTVKHLKQLSAADKQDIMRYICLCVSLCQPADEESHEDVFEEIDAEYKKLQQCVLDNSTDECNCARAYRRLELFQQVFKNIL